MEQKQNDLFADRLKDGNYKLHSTGAILTPEAFKLLHKLQGGHAVIFQDFGSPKTPGATQIDFNLAK